MAIEITVPRLGWSMEEGRFLGWLKQDGDEVRVGEPLFTLENDKAAQDVESTEGGILRIPADSPQPGETVPVGARLGWLVGAGEAVPMAAASSATTLPAATLQAAADHAAAVESPARQAAGQPLSNPASPRARRAAAELGVPLGEVAPGGASGRIRERDVMAAATAPRQPGAVLPMAAMLQTAAMSPTSAGATPAASPRDLAAASLRRTIAARMMASLASTAPVTLTCRADATNLVMLRGQFKAAGGETPVPAYTDIVAKLAAIALAKHPALAARWQDGHVVLPERIHIGIAVDTEQGLLVPVIRDVAELTLADLARRSQALIEAARARRSSPDDLQGGSFTITNLGGFGIEAFTPIINHPETAVLGLGAIRPEVVPLAAGGIGVRERIALSLTFDHRVVDGAPAARFLQSLVQGIENPTVWLLEGGPPAATGESA